MYKDDVGNDDDDDDDDDVMRIGRLLSSHSTKDCHFAGLSEQSSREESIGTSCPCCFRSA